MGALDHRTRAQREADNLDLELFNLSLSLQYFAERFGDNSVDDASRIVFGLRGRVQKHMHRDDLAKLNPTPSPAQGSGR